MYKHMAKYLKSLKESRLSRKSRLKFGDYTSVIFVSTLLNTF